MQVNKMTLSTNISTDAAGDAVISVLKADKRIWSYVLEQGSADHILQVYGEIEATEVEAKIHSIGFEAKVIK